MRAIVAPFARAAVVLCVVSSSPVSDVVLRACVCRARSREKFKFRITPRILRATVPNIPSFRASRGGIQPRRTPPPLESKTLTGAKGRQIGAARGKKTFERFLGLLNPRSEPILERGAEEEFSAPPPPAAVSRERRRRGATEMILRRLTWWLGDPIPPPRHTHRPPARTPPRMFAVSANARQLLIARPRAPASARGSSRRVAAAARPAAASSSARASDVEATTGAGARAMRAGAALALSAAVAFSSPGPALAALNKKGNSQDAYAEMMAQMEAQRCATTTAPPPTPTRRPIRDETKNQSARTIAIGRFLPDRVESLPRPFLPRPPALTPASRSLPPSTRSPPRAGKRRASSP